MNNLSALQSIRLGYACEMPALFSEDLRNVSVQNGNATQSISDCDALKEIFPDFYGLSEVSFVKKENINASALRKVGVLLSGGQAPGGHNVIAGLYDALKKANPQSVLYGFFNGTNGVLDCRYKELTDDIINQYRNTGGFDMIESGRTKIETDEHVKKAVETVGKLDLDALVVIGGDDSNTNAAFLAKHFKDAGLKTQVIGVPKTIDGDLRSDHIEITFGFDTTTKTYSEEIGNLSRDTASANKYWQFIKLMGRSASHITLECSLLTHPNVTLISEEIEKKGMSLGMIVDEICSAIVARAEKGINFGTVLIPEGVVEFVPEIKCLIAELNDLIADNPDKFTDDLLFVQKKAWMKSVMTAKGYAVFDSIPDQIAAQFIGQRDPHGNVQVSCIETENLLALMVGRRLAELKKEGKYNGKFTPQLHFFGFEGRAAMPSNFDANYCYTLGYTAFLLIANGLTGYICYVRNLSKAPSEWIAGGIPLTALMNMEKRNGKTKPVIAKALVDLDGKPFKTLVSNRENWALNTCYSYPGPIQFFGPKELCDRIPETIRLEQN